MKRLLAATFTIVTLWLLALVSNIALLVQEHGNVLNTSEERTCTYLSASGLHSQTEVVRISFICPRITFDKFNIFRVRE